MICIDCHGHNGCTYLLLYGVAVIKDLESGSGKLKVRNEMVSSRLSQEVGATNGLSGSLCNEQSKVCVPSTSKLGDTSTQTSNLGLQHPMPRDTQFVPPLCKVISLTWWKSIR